MIFFAYAIHFIFASCIFYTDIPFSVVDYKIHPEKIMLLKVIKKDSISRHCKYCVLYLLFLLYVAEMNLYEYDMVSLILYFLPIFDMFIFVM